MSAENWAELRRAMVFFRKMLPRTVQDVRLRMLAENWAQLCRAMLFFRKIPSKTVHQVQLQSTICQQNIGHSPSVQCYFSEKCHRKLHCSSCLIKNVGGKLGIAPPCDGIFPSHES